MCRWWLRDIQGLGFPFQQWRGETCIYHYILPSAASRLQGVMADSINLLRSVTTTAVFDLIRASHVMLAEFQNLSRG